MLQRTILPFQCVSNFAKVPVELGAFLCNQAPDIVAMDLVVVPTIGFSLLDAFVIVRLNRRDLGWIYVTANPTADWIARQMTEAFPWGDAPKYLQSGRLTSCNG